MPKKIDQEAVDNFAESLEKGAEAAKDGVSFEDLDEGFAIMSNLKGFITQLGVDKVSTLLALNAKISAMIVAERQASATE